MTTARMRRLSVAGLLINPSYADFEVMFLGVEAGQSRGWTSTSRCTKAGAGQVLQTSEIFNEGVGTVQEFYFHIHVFVYSDLEVDSGQTRQRRIFRIASSGGVCPGWQLCRAGPFGPSARQRLAFHAY